EAAPVELVGGNDGLLGGADLRALLERQLAATGVEAQAVLEEVFLDEVVAQAQFFEVLRAQLDARLADLVRRVGQGPRASLRDDDRERRMRPTQLPGERQPRQAAATDDDVIGISRQLVESHASHSRP